LLLPHRRQARELANSALGRAMRSAEHDEGRRFRLLAPTRTALTPRQLEVAERAADGQTNRQIARALGVSERTVHHHVAAVLTALDVPSRAAIGAALALPVPHPDHVVLARLTPTEHRVAELAATGRTMRGIGAALGISDRTAEKHLRAALMRIGVPSRAALVSRLGPPPWPLG
jgi:DNA-binding NarL/FixJ family response regulator